MTGATVSLARVKKPIVLAVWASWCTACARQASALRKFAQEHRREAAVIGLDLEDEPVDAQRRRSVDGSGARRRPRPGH